MQRGSCAKINVRFLYILAGSAVGNGTRKNINSILKMDNTVTTKRPPTPKVLLWISIGSMIMLFAGLTSGYIVRQAEGNWLRFDLPAVFFM